MASPAGADHGLAPAQGGGRSVVELLEGLVEAPHAAEAGGQGHLAHRQVGLVDQLLGQQHPPRLGHPDRCRAQMLQEQPPQLPPADARRARPGSRHRLPSSREESRAHRLDQRQGARDGVGRPVPGPQLRRGLGPAAQAGAIAGLLGRGGGGVEGDVLALAACAPGTPAGSRCPSSSPPRTAGRRSGRRGSGWRGNRRRDQDPCARS
jgi:hypothetical protein